MRPRRITAIAGALATAGLLGTGPAALARTATCRPAGAQAFDRNRAAGTLYVTGRPGERRLIGCRTGGARPVLLAREGPGRRLLSAAARDDDAAFVFAVRGGQRLVGVRLHDRRRRVREDATRIGQYAVGGGRIAWIAVRPGGRVLRLDARGHTRTLDTDPRLHVLALDPWAVTWERGPLPFQFQTTGPDPCAPGDAAAGPATPLITTFRRRERDPYSDNPRTVLYGCRRSTGLSTAIGIAQPGGLGVAEVSLDGVAGRFALVTYSSGDQYGGDYGFRVCDVAAGVCPGGYDATYYTGEQPPYPNDEVLDDRGDFAYVLMVVDPFTHTAHSGDLVLHDGAGERTVDSGTGIRGLALDDTTLRWTHDGEERSTALHH